MALVWFGALQEVSMEHGKTILELPEVLELLRNDHRQLKEFVSRISHTSERSPKVRSKTLVGLQGSFLSYSNSVQDSLYPALENIPEIHEAVFEGYGHIQTMRQQLKLLNYIDRSSVEWTQVFEEFRYVLERHVEEEEAWLFPIFSSLDLETQKKLAEKYLPSLGSGNLMESGTFQL
jgi:hypothetical protein